jgi:hypothetical protein
MYRFILLIFILVGHAAMAQQDTTRNMAMPAVQKQDSKSESKPSISKYPPKPKHAWELGFQLGHFMIDGDVDQRKPFSGYTLGLHVRRAIHYAFSLRVDASYSVTYGLEPQPYGASLEPEQFYQEPNGPLRKVFSGYDRNNPWFPSYRTQLFGLNFQGVLNIGNILFHKESNKWNWYLVLGGGVYHHRTMLDLRDGNGAEYTNLINRIGYTPALFNTREGRRDIKNSLDNIYDGDYETEAYKKRGIFRLADKHNIHFGFNGGMGLARKINRRFNIAIEHQLIASDNDYLDGIRYRSDVDQTNNSDVMHFTQLRLGINLGDLKKKKEPLYWLNPLDAFYNDLAELKARPKYDPTDTDADGIIDLIDQEPNSDAGALVDTKGISLDSDKDGIVDHLDAEPFSPPGYKTDEKGIALVEPKISEDDVNKLIDRKLGTAGLVDSNGAATARCCPPDWFLPTVHFNLDEYCVRPQYNPQLQQVASVMLRHPEIKVTAVGHTDIRNTDNYNKVLSYNRAKWTIDYLVDKYKIPRDRFILMYSGETSPFGNFHYANRRVEFRVSLPDDREMSRPEGPEAGDCHKKPVRRTGKVQTDNGSAEDRKSGY